MLSEFNKLCALYNDNEYLGKTISLNNVSHSKIRELEIQGETKEVGTGEKSPNNPYELISSKPELVICEKNLYKPVFGSFNKNINFDGEWFSIENFTNPTEKAYNLSFYTMDFSMITNGEYTIIAEISEIDLSVDTTHINFAITMDWEPSNRFSVFGGCPQIKITAPTKIIEHKETNIENATLLLSSFVTVPTGMTINKLKWRMAIYKGYVSEENYVYKPYEEQSVKMVSRNLYNTVSENYKMLNNINIEDTYLYIVNTANSGDSIMYSNYYYQNKDFLKTNTDYTIVCEVIEADYTGTITISPTSEYGEAVDAHDMFTKTFTINNPKVGIYKMTAKTRESFVNCNYAYRGLVSLYASAVINSLKFRISVIQADDIDLDSFVYEPYKDDYVLNSAGDIADTYNPLTGEYVQRVGKLVFDGSENWGMTPIIDNTARFYKYISGVAIPESNDNAANIICTHYNNKNVNNLIGSTLSGCGISTARNLSIRDNFTDVDSFKAYLQKQYTNGTPVTIYSELAEPVTTIINKVPVLANIPDTTMYIEESNDLGSIKIVLQTKGQ